MHKYTYHTISDKNSNWERLPGNKNILVIYAGNCFVGNCVIKFDQTFAVVHCRRVES